MSLDNNAIIAIDTVVQAAGTLVAFAKIKGN